MILLNRTKDDLLGNITLTMEDVLHELLLLKKRVIFVLRFSNRDRNDS